MLPSDMNLRTGRVQGYNNKILVSRSGFKLGTNVEINLDAEKDRPDAKSKMVEVIKIKPDVKLKKEPDIKSNKEHKQDTKPNIESNKGSKPEPNKNKITYEEEKVALVLEYLHTIVDVQVTTFSLSLS